MGNPGTAECAWPLLGFPAYRLIGILGIGSTRLAPLGRGAPYSIAYAHSAGPGLWMAVMSWVRGVCEFLGNR